MTEDPFRLQEEEDVPLTKEELAGVEGSFERLGEEILDNPTSKQIFEEHLSAIKDRHEQIQRHKQVAADIIGRPWRIGRKLGRTIYCMVGNVPSDDDILIGIMDHESVAAIAVLQHNNALQD